MRRRLSGFAFAVVVVVALGAAAAAAAQVDAPARVLEIRAQARTLAALADAPLPDALDAKERRRAQAFGQWLEKTSLELAAFADRWEAARSRAQGAAETREVDRSFEAQSQPLLQRIERQSRHFTLRSDVMQTRQRSAQRAIRSGP